MALLDLQGLELAPADRGGHGGGGGGSRVSLLLCGDSSLSLTNCD